MREWFKSIRTLQNLTLKQIAQMSNLDVTMISKIENGDRRPGVDIAKKLAEVMNFAKYGYDWTKFYESREKVS